MEEIVAQRVRELMKKKRFSIKDLASKLDMGESNLSNKLNNIRKIDVSTICVLLEAFPDLSAEWLLRGEGDMYKSQNYEQPKMGFGKFLMSMLANCSKSEATKIKNLVDSVVDIQENDEE